MQISSGDLSLSGSSTRLFRHERSERLETWVGERSQRQAAERTSLPTVPADHGLGRFLEQTAKARQGTLAIPAQLDPELEKLLTILEKIFGAKGARQFALKLQALQTGQQQAVSQAQQAVAQPQQAGWGLEYDLHERTVEVQTASLSVEAELTLVDGRSLAFSLDWSQTRVHIEERSVHLALGDAVLKDPLILDLDGDGISFGDRLAQIDVDSDGEQDTVAAPGGGDRILALDGAILGGASGRAFSDLSALDQDGNGWIDAGDAAYDRLQLWDGLHFSGLEAGGVAAIATASVALPFEHRDADGGLQAVGRRGGVYLREDGSAGAVAQVDLVA